VAGRVVLLAVAAALVAPAEGALAVVAPAAAAVAGLAVVHLAHRVAAGVAPAVAALAADRMRALQGAEVLTGVSA